MKPLLLLSTRPETPAAIGEADALRRFASLDTDALIQIRVEQEPLPKLDLGSYAGVILGGGPFNSSDSNKTAVQVRVEDDLDRILTQVFAHRIPFLGLCYGVGTVTTHLNGVVDRQFGEAVGAIDIAITDAGRADPLLADLGDGFRAFVGHKEAVSQLPEGAVLLATGDACPVQMYRVADHCWVTQFHPELDAAGIKERIHIYKMAGYFAPEEVDELCRAADAAHVAPVVHSVIARFAAFCAARSGAPQKSA